tara:strand:+ start:472 stop:759 length:288 start_codon:yes stop_codon:yes gene_type:complete
MFGIKNANLKEFNYLQIFLSALLFSAFNSFIRGINVDLVAPFLNIVLPGDVSKPVIILGIPFFVTRFIVRLINMFLAISVVYFIAKQAKKNNIKL